MTVADLDAYVTADSSTEARARFLSKNRKV